MDPFVGYVHTYTIISNFLCVGDILLLQIEDMCRSTRASAVPVVPDSEGFDSLLSLAICLQTQKSHSNIFRNSHFFSDGQKLV